MILKNYLKRVIPSLSSIVLVLVCFVIAPLVRAVVPAPDGGYPGFNTAEGQNALFNLTAGVGNTGVGWYSLWSDTDGSYNTAVGAGTLLFNVGNQMTGNGAQNTAIGTAALLNNTTGSYNTATGSGNMGIGSIALSNNSSGNNNIALGFAAGGAVSTANNVIAIGSLGQNVSNSCFIGQIYTNIQPQVGTDPDLVTINSNGRLGRANVSSRRYKHDIQPMHTASEAIYELKPVSFRYHKQYDQTQTIAFGLIAEEVAEVNPDLVGRNPEGQPESVRYEQINAMLLNEFLKEHRRGEEQDCKIQEQETTIAELRSEIRSLAAMVNDQASELRKVSAQLQISNAAAQEIASNRP